MSTVPPAPGPDRGLVVVIHGLYMHGVCLEWLARRLRRGGWRALTFSYPSLRRPVADNAAALARFVAGLDEQRLHFVAHSLGGLLLRRLLAEHPELPPGRAVTLGTPHQGSGVARCLAAGRLRFALGHSCEGGLLGDLPPWPANRELGSLAGTLNAGLGRLLGPVPAPGDGTVSVAETCLEGMTDHICLPVSHTGMLLSGAVAEQVCEFLERGRFRHGDRSGASA